MIEDKVRNYLKDKSSVPVFIVKTDNSKEYITMKKNGESGDRFIRKAMITFRAHGVSKLRAAQLCDELIHNVWSMHADVAEISSVKLNTTGDTTDESIRDYCYQAIFDITYNI